MSERLRAQSPCSAGCFLVHLEAHELDLEVERLVRLNLGVLSTVSAQERSSHMTTKSQLHSHLRSKALCSVRVLWRDDEAREFALGHRRDADVPALDHLLCWTIRTCIRSALTLSLSYAPSRHAPRPSWNSNGSSVPPTCLPSTTSRLQTVTAASGSVRSRHHHPPHSRDNARRVEDRAVVQASNVLHCSQQPPPPQ